jgi:Rieske Fe-S protein
VRWNDVERSWDCPLHGSRFEVDGTLIEGPATRGLAPVEGAQVDDPT